MGTVRYTVVDGEILSELRNGVKRDYVPDPLGSTVALLDSSQNITDTFSYWPYGESAGRTGTTATPFQYVGSFGYYQDGTARNYVRARYLDKGKGRWFTEDPVRFSSGCIDFYQYGMSSPTILIDIDGLHTIKPNDPRFPKPLPWTDADRYKCGCLLLDYKLIIERAAQIAEEIEHKRFPIRGNKPPIGERNGLPDAYRHCLFACYVTQSSGGIFNQRNALYNCGVIGLESDDAWASLPLGTRRWGQWNNIDSSMDLANDEVGRKGAPSGLCENTCLQKLNSGQLYVLPPIYWEPKK